MNKKVKFTILIIVSVILSISIPFIISIIPKKEQPQIDINKLQKEFQKTLEETVKIEKEKTAKEVQELLIKDETLENKLIESFAKPFTQYYGDDTAHFKTEYNPNKTKWNLSFVKDEYGDCFTTNDTGKEAWNGYAITHSFELVDDKKNIKQFAEIDVMRDKKDKFNIYENDILIQYLNSMLGRPLTEKDKNAINIKVNMNFSELKDIEDLKNYIYNSTSVKIDNLIIETELSEDVEKQRAFVKFKIICDRPLDLTPQKEETESNG